MEYSQTQFPTEKSPDFYKNYPKLFHEYFEDISNQEIDLLSEAGFNYYKSVLILDSIIDDNEISRINEMISLQEKAIKILTCIYGRDSSFWDLWEFRKSEFIKAILIEKSINNEKNIYKVYEDLADKKSAFGKVAIDSLYFLSQNSNTNIYNVLLESHKLFSVGFQLYDDVKDIQKDMLNGQFNWALFSLSQEIELAKYDAFTVNKLLHIKKVSQVVLKKSITCFNDAIQLLEKINVNSGWLKTNIEMKDTIENYLDITIGYISSLEKKIEIKNKENPEYSFFNYYKVTDKTVKNGLNFIEQNFSKNYYELKHYMYLSPLEGFENKTQVHVSDIFQRAMLNDCLLDVCLKYNIDSNGFFEHEIEYLLKNENVDEIGGWSYFPTVNEIAADIDDLGQIIQFFIKEHKSYLIKKHCEKAIDIVINERYCENGGFETWIIPKKNQNEIQIKQSFFNETKWGVGPNAEVVANFLYSLCKYDILLFEKIIYKNLEYIIKSQNTDGHWDSRWYYGKFYGTFVCLRLLKLIDNNNECIKKSLKFIYNSQNSDGGFGIDNNVSDPLSTSLALLSLNLFLDKKNTIIQKNARKYLINSQNSDGSWFSIDFIKPKVNEPYKSNTLTTAFVLKSLCK